MGYVLMLTCLWSVVGALVLSQGAGDPAMALLVALACVWSIVGVLVFFVRENISLTERLVLTISTSVELGVIGWVPLTNISDSVHWVRTAIAKESSHVD